MRTSHCERNATALTYALEACNKAKGGHLQHVLPILDEYLSVEGNRMTAGLAAAGLEACATLGQGKVSVHIDIHIM